MLQILLLHQAKRLIFIGLLGLVSLQTAQAQDKSTYYDEKGRQLSMEEAHAIMKGTFSMMKRIDDKGNEQITLKPMSNEEIEKNNEAEKAFADALLGKSLPAMQANYLQGEKAEVPVVGKVTVINFWFIACKPCVDEMPQLNQLVREFAGKEVIFIAPAPDSSEDIQNFLKNHTFNYQILPNARPWAQTLSINVYPTHLVVDQKGLIREVLVGATQQVGTKISRAVDKLLPK